jgi:hypothetical protein
LKRGRLVKWLKHSTLHWRVGEEHFPMKTLNNKKKTAIVTGG